MEKLKLNTNYSTGFYMLGVMVVFVLLATLNEIAIFETLDKIRHATYFSGLVSVLNEDTINNDIFSDLTHTERDFNEFAGFRESGLQELGRNKIVNSVHYIWCENKTFDFRNYLSVMSVWKILRPDIIEFHQKVAPISDKYDDWLVEIQKTIPCFVVKTMPANWGRHKMRCSSVSSIFAIEDRGGIYVREDVIVTEKLVKYLEHDMTLVFSKFVGHEHYSIAIAMGNNYDEKFKKFRENFHKKREPPEGANFCEDLEANITMNNNKLCYVFNEPLNPADEFQSETYFGEMVRRLMYGSTKKKEAKAILPGVIPKIVHYVWFGYKELDFMMFLSMLSTLFILNPEKVFIHTDGGLKGGYYDRLLKDKRIVLVHREKTLYIYGHKLIYTHHMSDIVRAECLLKYGGIYMDWDVLWLRNPDDLIQTGYDAIANFDNIQQGHFPDTINVGVLMAKPHSTFIKRWQDALYHYRPEDFLYNAVELPYKIYEKYPQYLKIEQRLLVMCFQLRCHPTFHKDFKNEIQDQPFDWRTDVYSIRFTYPYPPTLTNEHACKSGIGRFAEIGQFILQHEKRLK